MESISPVQLGGDLLLQLPLLALLLQQPLFLLPQLVVPPLQGGDVLLQPRQTLIQGLDLPLAVLTQRHKPHVLYPHTTSDFCLIMGLNFKSKW